MLVAVGLSEGGASDGSDKKWCPLHGGEHASGVGPKECDPANAEVVGEI